MQAIICYPNHQRIEVLVLFAGRFTMRVVPRHRADTIELKLAYGQWTDEAGESIEFEALLAGATSPSSTILEIANHASAIPTYETGEGGI